MQTRLVETMIEHCDWLFQDAQDEYLPTNTTPPATPPATTTTKPSTNELKAASTESIRRPPPQTPEPLVKADSAPNALQSLPPPSKPQRAPEEAILSPPARSAQRPPPAIPRQAPPTPPRPYSEEKAAVADSSKPTAQVESRGVPPPPPPRSGEDGVQPRPLPIAARPRPSVRQPPKKPVVEREMSAPAGLPAGLPENNVPTEIMFVIDGERERQDGEVASSSVTESGFVLRIPCTSC